MRETDENYNRQHQDVRVENGIAFEIYGDRGGLVWRQSEPSVLRITRPGQPAELRTPGTASLHPLAKGSPARMGGAGSFIEAFANIYADFALVAAARRAGAEPDPRAALVPGLEDGLSGLSFIDACLASTASGTWAECASTGVADNSRDA